MRRFDNNFRVWVQVIGECPRVDTASCSSRLFRTRHIIASSKTWAEKKKEIPPSVWLRTREIDKVICPRGTQVSDGCHRLDTASCSNRLSPTRNITARAKRENKVRLSK